MDLMVANGRLNSLVSWGPFIASMLFFFLFASTCLVYLLEQCFVVQSCTLNTKELLLLPWPTVEHPLFDQTVILIGGLRDHLFFNRGLTVTTVTFCYDPMQIIVLPTIPSPEIPTQKSWFFQRAPVVNVGFTCMTEVRDGLDPTRSWLLHNFFSRLKSNVPLYNHFFVFSLVSSRWLNFLS